VEIIDDDDKLLNNNRTEFISRGSILIVMAALSLFTMILIVSSVTDIPNADTSVSGHYACSNKWGDRRNR
jgi:hypothetical protein